MTGKLIPVVVAMVVAGAGLGAWLTTRSAPPDAVALEEYNCTTCDARQASKKRLSDHLQSQSDAVE